MLRSYQRRGRAAMRGEVHGGRFRPTLTLAPAARHCLRPPILPANGGRRISNLNSRIESLCVAAEIVGGYVLNPRKPTGEAQSG